MRLSAKNMKDNNKSAFRLLLDVSLGSFHLPRQICQQICTHASLVNTPVQLRQIHLTSGKQFHSLYQQTVVFLKKKKVDYHFSKYLFACYLFVTIIAFLSSETAA